MVIPKKITSILEDLFHNEGITNIRDLESTFREEHPDMNVSRRQLNAWLQQTKGTKGSRSKKQVSFIEVPSNDVLEKSVPAIEIQSPKQETRSKEEEEDVEDLRSFEPEKELVIYSKSLNEINKHIKNLGKDVNLDNIQSFYKHHKLTEILKLQFSLFVHGLNTLLDDDSMTHALKEALGVNDIETRLERLEMFSFHDEEESLKAHTDYWKEHEEEEEVDEEKEDRSETKGIEKSKKQIITLPETQRQEVKQYIQESEDRIINRTRYFV